MAIEYDIIGSFEITSRGTVVCLNEDTERSVGTPYSIEVLTPHGVVVKAVGYLEYSLHLNPAPIERECYLLKGLRQAEVPMGSRLRFLD